MRLQKDILLATVVMLVCKHQAGCDFALLCSYYSYYYYFDCCFSPRSVLFWCGHPRGIRENTIGADEEQSNDNDNMQDNDATDDSSDDEVNRPHDQWEPSGAFWPEQAEGIFFRILLELHSEYSSHVALLDRNFSRAFFSASFDCSTRCDQSGIVGSP